MDTFASMSNPYVLPLSACMIFSPVFTGTGVRSHGTCGPQGGTIDETDLGRSPIPVVIDIAVLE
jgi:hypothetical protein